MAGAGATTGVRPASIRERDAELGALRDAVRAAKAGDGGFVLIAGPAGIGKTRLLAATETLGRAAGLVVRDARASELERSLPFGVVLQLLERLATDDVFDSDERDPVARQMVATHRLYRRLADGEGPRLLLVDDLHWADAASLRWLAYAARRAPADGILIVATTRLGEPGTDALLLDELVDLAGAGQLRPRLLSDDATAAIVAELLDRDLEPAFASACIRATGGNPLLTRELARALGHGDTTADVERIGPDAVARSVRATLRRLPAEATALAEAVSVLGDGADRALAAGLAGIDETVVGELIAQTQRAELLLGERELRFGHPLLRQAVAASLAPEERERLHVAAAEALAGQGAATDAAAHLLEVPPAGRAWAVDALVAAAGHATHRADPARAAELLARAMREPPARAEVPHVLTALARAQAAAGHPDAATNFDRAIAATDDPTAKARLLLSLAWAHQDRGRFAAVARAAERGLALEPADADLRTELTAMRNAAVLWSPEDDPAAARVAPPPTTARSRADRVALADEARRLLFAGVERETAVELARQAWGDGAFLETSTSDDPAAIRILTVLHNSDLLRESLAVADACFDDARRRASLMSQVTWTHLRGHVLEYIGALEPAERALASAFAARRRGWGAWLPVNAAAQIHIKIEQDDLEAARAVVHAADASTSHPRPSPQWTNYDAARARLLLEQGDVEPALELIQVTDRRTREELGTTNPTLGSWWSTMIEALLALDRPEQAAELAERKLAEAETWGSPWALGRARVMRGRTGPPAEQLDWLRRAADGLETSETRLEYAYALLARGAAERDTDPALARETLRAAMDIGTQCRSARLIRLAGEELKAAGGRPRRRRVAGPQSLTASEQRVAEMAVAGLSNREIAEQLVVTPRAVAFHLGNVYRKLDITGRRELPGAFGG